MEGARGHAARNSRRRPQSSKERSFKRELPLVRRRGGLEGDAQRAGGQLGSHVFSEWPRDIQLSQKCAKYGARMMAKMCSRMPHAERIMYGVRYSCGQGRAGKGRGGQGRAGEGRGGQAA